MSVAVAKPIDPTRYSTNPSDKWYRDARGHLPNLTPEERKAHHLELKRATSRRYRERHPDRVKASRRKWVEKNPEFRTKWARENPEKNREFQRKYRAANRERLRVYANNYAATHKDQKAARRKRPLGRSCRSCERSDSEVSFALRDICVSCQRRGWMRGFCGCGAALSLRDKTGANRKRPFCLSCEKAREAARSLYDAMSEAQRAVVKSGAHTRVMTIWDLLEKTDGAEITSDDMFGMGYEESSLPNIWTRVWRSVVEWGLGTSAIETTFGCDKRILRIDRPRLRAFLEPVVQWIIWNGTGKGANRRGKARPKGEA